MFDLWPEGIYRFRSNPPVFVQAGIELGLLTERYEDSFIGMKRSSLLDVYMQEYESDVNPIIPLLWISESGRDRVRVIASETMERCIEKVR